MLNSSCIAQCNCVSTAFEPVCGKDNFTYFPPCTAGCLDVIVDNVTWYVYMYIVMGIQLACGCQNVTVMEFICHSAPIFLCTASF